MLAPDALGHGHRRQPLEQVFLEGRLQSRVDRHVPAALRREGPAFYRILLGHQHRQVLREVQILGVENVMVGEGCSTMRSRAWRSWSKNRPGSPMPATA